MKFNTKNRLIFVDNVILDRNNLSEFKTLSARYPNVIFFTNESGVIAADGENPINDTETTKNKFVNIWKSGNRYCQVTGVNTTSQYVNIGNINLGLKVDDNGLIGFVTASAFDSVYYEGFWLDPTCQQTAIQNNFLASPVNKVYLKLRFTIPQSSDITKVIVDDIVLVNSQYTYNCSLYNSTIDTTNHEINAVYELNISKYENNIIQEFTFNSAILDYNYYDDPNAQPQTITFGQKCEVPDVRYVGHAFDDYGIYYLNESDSTDTHNYENYYNYTSTSQSVQTTCNITEILENLHLFPNVDNDHPIAKLVNGYYEDATNVNQLGTNNYIKNLDCKVVISTGSNGNWTTWYTDNSITVDQNNRTLYNSSATYPNNGIIDITNNSIKIEVIPNNVDNYLYYGNAQTSYDRSYIPDNLTVHEFVISNINNVYYFTATENLLSWGDVAKDSNKLPISAIEGRTWQNVKYIVCHNSVANKAQDLQVVDSIIRLKDTNNNITYLQLELRKMNIEKPAAYDSNYNVFEVLWTVQGSVNILFRNV